MPLGLALTAPGLRLIPSAGILDTLIVSPPAPPPPPPPIGIFLATELGELLVTDLGDHISVETIA